MNTASVLWQNWHAQVEELLTGLHGHQKKTLDFLALGIVLSGSAVLQRVAEVLQQQGISEANMTSIERRLRRFVANDRIVLAFVWKPFLAQPLSYFDGPKTRLA